MLALTEEQRDMVRYAKLRLAAIEKEIAGDPLLRDIRSAQAIAELLRGLGLNDLADTWEAM